MSNRMLQFTDNNAADALYERLETAYEAHQANLFDAYDSWTDEQMDTYALANGYDEWLPYKEFEASFGLYNLRQVYQAQIDAYNTNRANATCSPENGFLVGDIVLQTMLTPVGQMEISTEVVETAVSTPIVCPSKPCTPIYYCGGILSVVSDTVGNIIVEKKLRRRLRQTSNWFPAVLRAKAKGKVSVYKITGPTSRRPYSTKMSVRIYFDAYDTFASWNTPPCGNFLTSYDSGFNALRRRWQRHETKKWNDINFTIPACGFNGEYNLPAYGVFYHKM